MIGASNRPPGAHRRVVQSTRREQTVRPARGGWFWAQVAMLVVITGLVMTMFGVLVTQGVQAALLHISPP